ncbi:YiiX/YebB-like N1pC/P60 family cysteine hydrolase (plasmid) [Rhizobium sp. CB3060]|uniref:YiiX/YebB-like N1pC/P60 family cysteine hydrolase n=1 Tax=Rhizobium sp. CB3060 TaxID=3138255 RepID=UPI0021A56864|nr:YiiX/YebB-like N1pC/P60 family cysteine hydrolase [Rhizobium tropici]UWU25129.1 YiiX/YebB-like N1pC/P60 family cysteine hydrolase [Rhizobium tropici]
MKKLTAIAILCVCLVVGTLYAMAGGDYPPLKDGDLIFQTSTSNQSSAIIFATGSAFSHMGIIKNDNGAITVIEAGAKVKETPLKTWVNRGLLRQVAIYRDPRLTPETARQLLSYARTLYGKPYDLFFSFNNDAIYCSELPYLTYKAAGIEIGKVQKISELHIDNMLVRNLVQSRWQRDSECTERGYDFDQCYKYILNQSLVTPVSIANDPNLRMIYSNYPL